MMNRQIRRAIVSAIVASGLVAPVEAKSLFIPEAPAIIKPAEFWKPHEKKLIPVVGMPLTLGMLAPKAIPAIVTTFNGSSSGTTAAQTTQTWTSAPIGTASGDRYVVICVLSRSTPSGARTLNSLSIGGTNASIIATRSVTSVQASIAILLVTSGTTATVVATYDGNMVRWAMASYSIVNLLSTTPFVTPLITGGTADPTGTQNISAGGCAIAMVNGDSNTVGVTWTGLGEDVEVSVGGAGGEASGMAHSDFASAVTPLTITADRAGVDTGTNMIAVSMR